MNVTEKLPGVDRSAEKLALAKELGLYAYVSAKELLKMKFKPISYRQISNKIGVGKFVFKPHFGDEILGYVGAASFILMKYLPSSNGERIPMLDNILYLIGIGIFVWSTIFLLFDRIVHDQMPLSDWKDELPYGALLSVKEAKASEIDHFEIHYPCLRSARVKADPVITGKKDGVRLEIFSWDDSKIYE